MFRPQARKVAEAVIEAAPVCDGLDDAGHEFSGFTIALG
jgi:hypothetical protein